MAALSSFVRTYPGRLRRMSFLLFVLVGVTLFFGVAFIYGTGQQSGGSFAGMWKKQLIWITLGAVAAAVIAGIDYRRAGPYCWLIYAATVLLLVAVLIVGAKINGARSWIRLGGGISLQPAEFAKVGLLFLLSWAASRPSVHFQRLRDLAPFVMIAALPALLILLQPDYGSAGVLIPVALAILFVSGIKTRWLGYGFLIVLCLTPALYRYGLKEHQKKRINTFLHPSSNPTREGWNARQSLLAVGSGGFGGKGYMQGTQNVLGFLPQTVAPTDFIFSVIAEELGFVGGTILIILFDAIFLVGLYTAMKAPDAFGRNLACGIVILFAVHVYVNVGMTMGMAPIIGIPLPFVSYGGSFMIVAMVCVGILQSIYCQRECR